MPPTLRPPLLPLLGDGWIGRYGAAGDALTWEGPRPGVDWHRHDWRSVRVLVLKEGRLEVREVRRRRWLLYRTTRTRQDRAPDEVAGMRATVLVVFMALWAWLGSGSGLHAHDALVPSLADRPSRRTAQRWLCRLAPDGAVLQQALRTAVIERFEPQPVELLFPGGLSPPGAVRCRRWKDPAPVYSFALALAFLFEGARALSTRLPVLLAEAHRRLDRPLGSAAP